MDAWELALRLGHCSGGWKCRSAGPNAAPAQVYCRQPRSRIQDREMAVGVSYFESCWASLHRFGQSRDLRSCETTAQLWGGGYAKRRVEQSYSGRLQQTGFVMSSLVDLVCNPSILRLEYGLRETAKASLGSSARYLEQLAATYGGERDVESGSNDSNSLWHIVPRSFT